MYQHRFSLYHIHNKYIWATYPFLGMHISWNTKITNCHTTPHMGRNLLNRYLHENEPKAILILHYNKCIWKALLYMYIRIILRIQLKIVKYLHLQLKAPKWMDLFNILWACLVFCNTKKLHATFLPQRNRVCICLKFICTIKQIYIQHISINIHNTQIYISKKVRYL